MIDGISTDLSHDYLMSNRWLLQGYVILLMLCCKAMCSGIFEVSLLKLNNHRGVAHNGRCCGGFSTSPPCSEECQTFFSVCVLQYIQSIPSHRSCTYGEVVTSVLGGNNISADDEEDGIIFEIPINFTWPGQFTLIVESWHDSDGQQRTYDASQLIVQAFIATSISPSLEWRGDTTITPTTEMQIMYRLLCKRNYYGNGCDVHCRSRDDQFGHYTCNENGTKNCKDGWTGTFCENPKCSAKCIQNRGVCERPFECRCRLGWQGEHCGECRPYTGCLNGYCHRPYQCICREGWTGRLCDIDTNYCTKSKPCIHGGTCISDLAGNYTCLCPTGFRGNNCQYPLCYDGFCKNNGVCQTRHSIRECSCKEKFYGDQCENEILSCGELKCINGGRCNMGEHGGSCHCPEAYTGQKCETRIDPCFSNPCQNDAECRATGTFSTRVTCVCPPGFGGEDCSISIDPCSAISCFHGGKCKVKSSKPQCVCLNGFSGEYCEISVDPCGGINCLNGGTCKHSPMNNGFICYCAKGYHGEVCEDKLNPCDSSPCKGGGVCKSYTSRFLCICPDDLSGKYCESKKVTSHRTPSTQNDDSRTDTGLTTDEEEGPKDQSNTTNGSSILSLSIFFMTYLLLLQTGLV